MGEVEGRVGGFLRVGFCWGAYDFEHVGGGDWGGVDAGEGG